MKVALCDDSIEFQHRIYDLCKQFFDKKEISAEVDKYSSGPALLEATTSYDLILLDMEMPEMNGIEVGRALREKSPNTEIIFITSFAEYAIDGYQVQAFGYLLKNDLNQTLNACLSSVIAKITAKRSRRLFKFVEGHTSLLLDDLIYVESRAKKLIFHVRHQGDIQETAYHLYGKIDDIQYSISEFRFIRTNQSYLVNSAHIKKVKCYDTELSNGEILSIPKARYSHVKEQYALYKGGYCD